MKDKNNTYNNENNSSNVILFPVMEELKNEFEEHRIQLSMLVLERDKHEQIIRHRQYR